MTLTLLTPSSRGPDWFTLLSFMMKPCATVPPSPTHVLLKYLTLARINTAEQAKRSPPPRYKSLLDWPDVAGPNTPTAFIVLMNFLWKETELSCGRRLSS